MKKRLIYGSVFLLLLALEICIGAFVRDDFVRPYVGDVLVTVLLCALFRVAVPEKCPWLPLGVFLFAAGVELIQLIPKPALEGTLLGIAIGSTFDPKDLLCYGIGCALFFLGERIVQWK